ncbi:MAG: hypothetical protein JWN73_2018 [Betaproteobacteria bacterium]|nr:hypothetical protein [Betaproteobacteria bacterium]
MNMDSEGLEVGATKLPQVMLQLAEVLPQFESEALESQLQSFDVFLEMMAPEGRPKVARLLAEAAAKSDVPERRARIAAAADSVARGGRAAAPYNHEEAMRVYRAEFRKQFPQADVPEPKHPRDERDEEGWEVEEAAKVEAEPRVKVQPEVKVEVVTEAEPGVKVQPEVKAKMKAEVTAGENEAAAADTPLPWFKYHPDPIATGSVVKSAAACACCGHVRGYAYVGPVYSEEEYEAICPWCIADGRANDQLGASFSDEVGGYGDWEEVPERVSLEVTQRTPGFCSWQQARWWTHCGDAGEFLGAAGKAELLGMGEKAVAAIRAAANVANDEEWVEFFRALDRDHGPTAYLFRCRQCKGFGGYWDCHQAGDAA